ncbi:ribosome biogenesis factor YjgA [Pseudomarimonas arenosa]|uniref:Dual-action ribosomal maturation protein DarP n=1 Tax=Pseudomarimonas arenosa TaxID=2774145 RepID=A0AAW3ZLH6_9GAMM|nr:ribosome biogenesis factor YjgA [Pseudomarimonas arenosa]MBD8526998.1 DUF615 domain-containing protein [Pseudomarimonas arenosa]
MRGRDPESGDFLAPSRSQRKREAEAVLELAEKLVALSTQQLGGLPIADHLRDAIRDTQRITSHIARKRQLHYLAKLMRREDDEELQAIRDALHHEGAEARRETALLHRLESWRQRLLNEGDAALGQLAELFPELDRHHMRQLMRNARDEHLHNKPPQAFREIFRELKTLFDSGRPSGDEEE